MITIMGLARELDAALNLPTHAEASAAAQAVLSANRLGIMRLLSDSDYPGTETVRVSVTDKDRAAYALACLAWPTEADDHRQRWYRRIVFEPAELDSVVKAALGRGSDPAEVQLAAAVING